MKYIIICLLLLSGCNHSRTESTNQVTTVIPYNMFITWIDLHKNDTIISISANNSNGSLNDVTIVWIPEK